MQTATATGLAAPGRREFARFRQTPADAEKLHLSAICRLTALCAEAIRRGVPDGLRHTRHVLQGYDE